MTYIAIVEEDSPDNYGIWFPDLPGCTSATNSLDTVFDMAQEALTGHIEAMQEVALPIPVPRSLHELRQTSEFIEESESMIVIAVRLRETVLEAAE
ncbi:MAG: type II toxin-antitoxin system HicB family antitoxin [Ahrensia sp.]|nr:type II toxin-antitoxin system HicB family antitoxin [Ahrensia sp.]